jgi:uncharacterized protein (TIGR00251 family)
VPLRVEEREGSCAFRVHVSPRSRKDEIVGLHGDALKVRLKAAPVRGRANRALERFLAEQLGIPAARVTVTSGHTSRRKRVQAVGVSAEHVLSSLTTCPPRTEG